MDALLNKISQLGVNLNTDVIAVIGKYWLIREIYLTVSTSLIILGLAIMLFIVIRNFGTGKWK